MHRAALADVEFIAMTAWAEFLRPRAIAIILETVVPNIFEALLADIALIEEL